MSSDKNYRGFQISFTAAIISGNTLSPAKLIEHFLKKL